MKKIIFTGLLFITSILSNAQEGPTDAISYLPHRANGFLVLNSSNFNTVTRWKVKIESRTTNIPDNKFEYEVEYEMDLVGAFYTKIDSRFLNPDHYITVQGINSGNVVVIEQGPIPINPEFDPFLNACQWNCIGKTYAYSLDLWTAPNDASSFVSMNNVVPRSGEPYFYEWVSSAHWSAFTGGGPGANAPAYYGLQDFSTNIYNLGKIIHLNVEAGDYKINASGTPISGSVYGIKKDFGPWVGQSSMMNSNTLMGGSSNCNQNFNWAKSCVNSGDNTPSVLSCDGQAYELATIEPEANIYEPCVNFFAEGWSDGSEQQELTEMLEYLIDCTQGVEGGNNTPNFTWPEYIYSFVFTPYYGATGEEIILTYDSLFDENGLYVGAPMEIGIGLYHVGIQYSDASYGRAFFESFYITVSNFTQADFLGVNAYPVPISGDAFNLNFVSSAKVSFTYELLNSNAKVLYSKSYVIEKDKSLNDEINVESGIPEGILFNRITFRDGSVINFQTIK